jgi:hypothetical protein
MTIRLQYSFVDRKAIKRNMQTSALFSACGCYRYQLRRTWDATKPVVLFIGLNPSMADAVVNDPTSTVCINYARRWGYGTLLLANLFAYRSTTPRILRTTPDPIGPENDLHIQQLQAEAALVVCAWGNMGNVLNRDIQVLSMLNAPHCLTKLKSGQPGHPLYKSAALMPMPLSTSQPLLASPELCSSFTICLSRQ